MYVLYVDFACSGTSEVSVEVFKEPTIDMCPTAGRSARKGPPPFIRDWLEECSSTAIVASFSSSMARFDAAPSLGAIHRLALFDSIHSGDPIVANSLTQATRSLRVCSDELGLVPVSLRIRITPATSTVFN